MIRTSIRVRLAAWYLLVLSTGMLLLGAVVWIWLRHAMLDSLDESLVSRKASFVRFLEKESQGRDLAALREESREYSTGLPSGHSLRVWAPDGSLLFAAPDQESVHEGNRLLEREETSVLGQRLSIELGASLEEVDDTLALLRAILLSSIPLVLIVATAGGWWISSRALRPVDMLTAAAEAIGLRDLSRRLPVPGTGDELQRLAEAWNRMLDRIAASVQQMKRFTTDAAHELRTPVTIVFSTAELALRRERDPASYRAALSGIQEETGHLARLVEELMWLARTDVASFDLNSEDVSVEDLISDAFRAAVPLAEHRGITLQVQNEGCRHSTIRCDRRPMRRCLLILLDNAIKFTPPGGSIRIRAVSQADMCRIEVHDSGSGVAEQHLPHIFDRFYQADKSRATSGFGLGLSIAKGIVEAHQGLIGVISNTGNGCCFYVELPLNDAQLRTSVAG